uniref:Uncharacterized protein n=1 Tax=Gopherus agassizii TaxID=38772 RepID=A0A452HD89_9SAUR
MPQLNSQGGFSAFSGVVTFQTYFFPPEEPEYSRQRFYLFNELTILHDEREAIQAPAFVFTKARLEGRGRKSA